jgi:hypothetical protein
MNILRLAACSTLNNSQWMAHCDHQPSATQSPNMEVHLSENNRLPTRPQAVQKLKTTKEYDVLVIGGGATGCGKLW